MINIFALDFRGSLRVSSQYQHCGKIRSVFSQKICYTIQHCSVVGGKRDSLVTAHLHKLSTSMCTMSGKDFRVKPETLYKYFQASATDALQSILLYTVHTSSMFLGW